MNNTTQAKSVLCYMDFATHTGFSSVSHNLMDRLLPWFEAQDIYVHICATNYLGKPFWYKGKNGGKAYVRAAKDTAKNMKDLWYRDGMLKLLNEGNYDLLWCINDIPVFSPMMQILSQVRNIYKPQRGHKNFKAVLYTPVDSRCNPEFMNDLDFWDELVTYTEYGKVEIEKHKPIGKWVKTIPHGANKEDFYKIPDFDKAEARRKWKLPENAFLFGNINKNNSRKNMGGTLLAFRYFVDWFNKQKTDGHKQEPALYLHCSPTDETGINLYRAAKTLGIENYVHYPTKDEYIKGGAYTLPEMNEIYNLLDCYVTTTSAEGWGLTITEAMAVELPIVAPMHTSIKEITEKGSACYPVSTLMEHFQIADYENVRLMPDPNDTFCQMMMAYTDVQLGEFPFGAAYKDILNVYDWDKIAEQWKSVFEGLI